MTKSVCFIVLVACGSSGPNGAGADAAHDSSNGPDAKHLADAKLSSPPLDAYVSNVSGYGHVTLLHATDFDDYTLSAEFDTGTEHVNHCMAAPINGCCVISTVGFVVQATSIGAISVDDGGATVASMTADPSGLYPVIHASSGGAIHWASGDHLDVSASGSGLSAFATSVVAPGPVTGLVPPVTGVTHHSLSSDLTVQWTPDASSTDITLLLDNGLGGTSVTIQCLEPETQGSVVIAHSMFSQVGLLQGGMGALTAINSNTTSLLLAGSSSPVTVVARAQVGGSESLSWTQ